jgi:hypothetical protein
VILAGRICYKQAVDAVWARTSSPGKVAEYGRRSPSTEASAVGSAIGRYRACYVVGPDHYARLAAVARLS